MNSKKETTKFKSYRFDGRLLRVGKLYSIPTLRRLYKDKEMFGDVDSGIVFANTIFMLMAVYKEKLFIASEKHVGWIHWHRDIERAGK